MKRFKGWKTILFNLSAIAVIQWYDIEQVVNSWEWLDDKVAMQILLFVNIVLRLITTTSVWEMWKDKDDVSENPTE